MSSRLQPQQLRVLLGHDLQNDAIEIRQRAVVCAPCASSAGCGRARPAVPAGTRAGRTGRCRRSPRAAWCWFQAAANVPAASAASSLCFGRIGSWSSRRSPGPDGAGIRDDDGVRVGRGGADRLPAGHQDAGQHALRLRVEDRPQREQHVGRGERRAVGPGHARAAGGACASRPSALDSHFSASHGSSSNVARLMRTSRPCVSWREELGRLVAGDEPVERPRLGADRGDDLAATAWRRVRFNSGRIARSAPQRGTPSATASAAAPQNRPTREVFTLQFLDAPVNFLAASETVQISAHNRAMPNTAPRRALPRLKRPSL